MGGHILPMTIVVLSHIMSIYPSAAAPQHLIIPAGIIPVDLPTTTRDEKMYDNDEYGDFSSWEGSSLRDEKNSPSMNSRNNLIDAAILLSTDSIGGDDDFTMNDTPMLTNSIVKDGDLNPKMTSALELSLWRKAENKGGGYNRHGLWNVPVFRTTETEPENCIFAADAKCGRKAAIPALSTNYWISNPMPSKRENSNQENGPMITMPEFSRNEKRSPRCLRRCLAQGLLHPSQCHSLC